MVLPKLKLKTCLVYMGDVIIFQKSIKDDILQADEILTTLAEAFVTLKMKKCTFFSDKVEYLVYVICPGKLKVDNVHTVWKQAKRPTTKSELRFFLELCNVYRSFISDFTGIVNPLNQLFRKGTPDNVKLEDDHLKSFSRLIDRVCSPTILALSKPNIPYLVETDALAYSIGCTLFHNMNMEREN